VKRLRLLLLVFTLLALLLAFHYQRENAVRVETVWVQSQIRGKVVPYNVVLPRGYHLLTPWKLRYPVLYLLHGYAGNYTSWTSQTALTSHLSPYNMIIVTPDGEDGWYTDSATQEAARHETFIVEELIPDVQSRYRVLDERSGRAVAGYSMGGYGALKFGLKYPDMFVFAGSMSGAFDAPTRTDDLSIMRTFGAPDGAVREANNLAKLASEPGTESRPSFYFDCGKDDPWLAVNRELHAVFLQQGIRHDYRELSGGHDWAYWDRQVRDLLALAAVNLAKARR
jgi:S-formylglutathione hydrolase FrmB